MRKKSDGTAFEHSFKQAMESEYIIKRLPTTSISQPADFYCIGKQFNYVEVKETTGDRFSISQMQQYEEFIDFIELRDRLASQRKIAIKQSEYILVVHFLKYGVIKVVNSEEMLNLLDKRSTLRYNSEEGKTFTSLEELVKEIRI